jgi:hypothetical protein
MRGFCNRRERREVDRDRLEEEGKRRWGLANWYY